MAGVDLAVRLLGSVEVLRDGTPVAIGGPTQRALLAMLALRADESVPLDTLAEGIWGESDEPLGGDKALRVYVARLRASLDADEGQIHLLTVPGGYRLDRACIDVDATEFERLLAQGRQQLAAGDARAALTTLDAALDLWRGPALMGVRDFPFASHLALRYDELRVDATEERIQARLALGEDQSLVSELHGLIGEHPYRERLHAQLMLAHYRAGQQAAALAAFRAARSRLILDLGVEPGPGLARLQQRILNHDPGLVAAAPSPAIMAAPARAAPLLRPRIPSLRLLVGRETLLAELETLAVDTRLLTLTGAGGSGKTVLALALLHRMAPRYADGAAFVDLASVAHPEQVVPAIAAAMGVSVSGTGLVDRMAGVLSDRRMLVLLDNCEHVLDATADLAPLATATSGLLLATSRAPLRLRGERVVDVPPLPIPNPEANSIAGEPAVELFVRAAVAAGAHISNDPAEVTAIGHVCRMLDGLPLAIEIAAAQARVESPAQLAASIRERLPRLPTVARDSPERQRTLEACIGWSLDRVDGAHRSAFGQLAIFAGSFDARGAAAVLDTDRARAIALLAGLLDASLLAREPHADGQARFRMLEPLRAVATALPDSDRAGAASRHAAFMELEIDRICPVRVGIRSPADLRHLGMDHANLWSVLEHLATVAPDRCASRVVQLDEFWLMTGRDVEARGLLGRLIAGRRLSDSTACLALAYAADLRHEFGLLDEAHDLISRSIALLGRTSGTAIRARVRLYQAHVAAARGDAATASRAARAAARAARAAGDQYCLVRALIALGVAGDRARLDEALAIARQHDLPHSEALVLYALLAYYLRAGELSLATSFGQRAIAFARRFDTVDLRTSLVEGPLGMAAVRAGQLDRGKWLLLSALRNRDRRGKRVNALHALSGLAELEAALGRWRNALALAAAVEALGMHMGSAALVPDEYDDAVTRAAAQRLDPQAAIAARELGSSMSYREAVDFAFQINGVSPGPI